MSIINEHGTNLFLLLVTQGFLPDTAQMITAQAAHETGNFTSPIFRLNNNPFGMKLPEVRRTTAIGTYKGHAVYKSIESAVEDYWLYYNAQKYPFTWKDVETFVEALKKHSYFEAPLQIYKDAVRHFYNIYFGE